MFTDKIEWIRGTCLAVACGLLEVAVSGLGCRRFTFAMHVFPPQQIKLTIKELKAFVACAKAFLLKIQFF